MDDHEKMALRRRKPVFAESVDLGKELLADLHSRGLLNDDAIEQLKAEKSIGQKSSKLIDWLIESRIEKAFEELCNALVSKYPTLSKEMQTEVRIERGDIVIDEDVQKEAATLVHRKFGTSRRFAETDKKDMTDLIAIKIQLSKEEFRQEMDQVRQELNRYIDLCRQKDVAVKAVDESLITFQKRYEEELVSRAHGMVSTTDIIITSVDDQDYIGKLKERLKVFLQRTERVIEERELMTREREKAQKSLNEVTRTLSANSATTAKAESDKIRKEMESKDALIKRLRKMNEAAEKDAEEKEQTIKKLTQEYESQSRVIGELEEQVKTLETERHASKEVAKAAAPEKKTAGSATKSTNSLSVRGTAPRQPSSGSTRKGVGSAKK